MPEITCSLCGHNSPKIIFHCPRCGNKLLTGSDADRTQIILTFHPEIRLPVAIFRNGAPLEIRTVEIVGPKVTITTNDGPIDKETIRLFEILGRGEESWDID